MKERDVFVLGINGSPHKVGRGAKLLRQSLRQADREGARTELVHLIDWPLPIYPGYSINRFPKRSKALFQNVRQADALILSTPTRWYSRSALIGNFIEWLTVFDLPPYNYALLGKVAGFIATCEEDSGQQAINDIAAPLVHMGFMIPPWTMVFHNINMAEESEGGWQLKDHLLTASNVVKLARLTVEFRTKGSQYWHYGGMARSRP